MDEEDEKRREQLEWLKSHPLPISAKNKDAGKDKRGFRHLQKRKKPSQAKSGRILETRVEEQIDLHGLTVDEAMAMVLLLIESWKGRGGGRIRIIHGRGNRSPDSIQAHLYRNINTVWRLRIASHFQEPHNSGATIIVLNALN